MGRIAPQPGIMEIALYEGGASHLPGRSNILKLSSNENPAGPPEDAQAALIAAASGMHRYPSTDHAALRTGIAHAWGVDPDRIVCGVGSDEVITFLCQAYAGPGLEVIHTEHGFAMYRISALAAGATPVEVPETERTVDVDAILAALTSRTRLVFLANPANPTGTMIPLAEVSRLAEGLPAECLLVLDGAYAEYAEGYDGGIALVEAGAPVVMTRTFSKIYGLGGLRVGWGYAAREVIDVLNRVRGPFNLSVPALAAAEAAVADAGYVARSAAENARLRALMTAELRALGLACDESHANFVLPRFASGDEAGQCEAHLRGAGILVRRTGGYKLPEALRITVGTADDCARVLGAIRDWRAGVA